ncbi:hypothetical protein MNBD_GAMMA21-509 [hydrothermal vent metagenome]|uniref:ATP/GTP-binding protein n=1 Tax=hydrothermal vent metagenome TaxID=652676 RepID=A0A3B1AEA5_9ZZZZ
MHLTSEKIIFTGPVGAGKTTAIGSVSDDMPVKTDVNCSNDNEKNIKDMTTVAMDYSYIQFDDNSKIHLFGTPGQKRFDFMWKILTEGGLGLVLLINNDHPSPVKQMEFYLDAFEDFIKQTGVVIGITRSGAEDRTTIDDYQSKLFERGQIFPVFEIDGRCSDDVKILLNALLAVITV